MTFFESVEKKSNCPINSIENPVLRQSKNLFTKKGNKLVFNFRHFVNSEEVIEAYLNAKSYNR